KKYNINLPYKDNNKDGITDIEDINGENGSDLESDVKKSCTAILNALYLLTGRKYKIVATTASGYNIDLRVDTHLTTKLPNTDDPAHPIPGKKVNNAIYHFIRAFEEGGNIFDTTFPSLKDTIEKIKNNISKFDSSLAGSAEKYGFSKEIE
ncbi:MAG: hypothetical protein HY934_05050, partial [Candidatus Firestonebacteria bacterium]|nr:hypothetical protein [Candidatus Firestonebacteria bacterium]